MLVEKSPPNLLQTRFLQALFPEAPFVMIVRHPVATSLATQKWSRTPSADLLRHWVRAHERFLADAEALQRVRMVRYEDLMTDPDGVLGALFAWLGLAPFGGERVVQPGLNEAYLRRWGPGSNPAKRLRAAAAAAAFGRRVRPFGYRLDDVSALEAPTGRVAALMTGAGDRPRRLVEAAAHTVTARETPPADAAAQGATTLLESAASTSWRGPDAYDGLWHPWPRPLVGGVRRRQLLMQLHARSPFDMRRLVPPPAPAASRRRSGSSHRSACARTASRATARSARRSTARRELLDADRGAGRRGWGYHWDMQTRWSFYPAGSPNVVVTAFAASGLLEVAAARGAADLATAPAAAARWVRDELWVEPEGYFAYHGGRPVNIHNANLLGAWLVDVAPGRRGRRRSASRAPSTGRSTPSAPTDRGRTARGATSRGRTPFTRATC